MPEQTTQADRGRDVSAELTEVRTVLSRAEDARRTLWLYQQGEIGGRRGHWNYDVQPAVWVDDGPYQQDPDVAEMIEALDETILRLQRWRRTGRAPKPPRK